MIILTLTMIIVSFPKIHRCDNFGSKRNNPEKTERGDPLGFFNIRSVGVVYRWNKKVWEYNTVLYVRSSYSVHYIVLQLASKLLAGMLFN